MEGHDAGAGAVAEPATLAVATRRRFCATHGLRGRSIAELSKDFRRDGQGISFASDDAMLRRARMTIAALKKRIDRGFKAQSQAFKAQAQAFKAESQAFKARFDAVDRRFRAVDARLDSMDDKLDVLIRMIDGKHAHQAAVLDEHERRLSDLERRVGA
jgi:hypothetical protein